MDSPDPPDPDKTAKAQAAANKDTANYQAALNATSQVGPDGKLTYTQDGTWSNGAPKWTATTELSQAGQHLHDTNQATQQGMADIAGRQTTKVGGILDTPFNLGDASESKYEQLGRTRLDPLWAQRGEQNQQDMANRGIRAGSAAYKTLDQGFNQSRNDAYNSLYINGKGLFDQEALTERNQPLNEISALMSGSQVSQPNFVTTPQTGVANTDVAGIYQNAYNAKAQKSNAAMGGLFGLAAAPFGMFSFGGA